MSKLIILSNRVTIPNGQKTTAGGLAVAIQDALDDIGGVWLGWNGERVHKQEEVHFNIFRSVHDKFHRTLVLSGFFFLKIASTFLNSSFFPKPIKRRIAI